MLVIILMPPTPSEWKEEGAVKQGSLSRVEGVDQAKETFIKHSVYIIRGWKLFNYLGVMYYFICVLVEIGRAHV